MRVGIIAGEASGDILGAGLIEAIRKKHPGVIFEGIAGPRMQAQGAHSLYPMERLSVMGIVEVLGRYWELSRARKRLIQHFLDNPPDLFIGIDAPDFTLYMESCLKQAGIPTVHYVSPSVWAWRQGRIHKIARSVDHMLTLFPFEADFYRQHNVPVTFVGHPLADALPLEPNQDGALKSLGLSAESEWVALLPGSRVSEVSRLAEPFIRTAAWCHERRPSLRFVVPLATPVIREIFTNTLQKTAADLPVVLLDGQSHAAMEAADAILLASGTAALEAMLLKKPMVVAYKVAKLTEIIAKRLLKVSNYSLPNLLAGETLVPEFVQERVTPQNLGRALLRYFEPAANSGELPKRFLQIHKSLRCNASERAAEAVLGLIKHD